MVEVAKNNVPVNKNLFKKGDLLEVGNLQREKNGLKLKGIGGKWVGELIRKWEENELKFEGGIHA